jgi:hypothetical protein
VIDGGAGNDSLVYKLTADLFDTNAAVDSIDGGADTDTLTVGTTGTAFAVAATDVWSRISNVETLTAVANTEAVTIDLDVTAYAAGLRTVDISAAAKATGNVIDASEITGGGMTLTGSATGVTTFTDGAGDDTITGGSAADVITTTTSTSDNDTIVFAATAALNGTDVLNIATGDILNFSAFLGEGYSIVGELGAAITAVADSGTADVNITGKLAVLEVAAADDGTVDAASELFALIDGSGDAFALSSGRAVVVVNTLGTAGGDDGSVDIFFLDTTLDGSSGLSVNDIKVVGASNTDIVGTDATWTWATANFA